MTSHILVRPVCDGIWRNESNTVRVGFWGGYWNLTIARTIGGEYTDRFKTREKLICWLELNCNAQIKFSDDAPAVVFSTVHKAKGLEWDRVFVIRESSPSTRSAFASSSPRRLTPTVCASCSLTKTPITSPTKNKASIP